MNIQIVNANIEGDRSLTLRYIPHNNIQLGDSKTEVLKHLHYLWQFNVEIVQENKEGIDEIIERCGDKDTTT